MKDKNHKKQRNKPSTQRMSVGSALQRLRNFSLDEVALAADLEVSSLLELVREPGEIASVHDLTKVKLLAYYARRVDAGMQGPAQRERATSLGGDESSFGGANLRESPTPESGRRSTSSTSFLQMRSGSLRAARTQRIYSEPPMSVSLGASPAGSYTRNGQGGAAGAGNADATAPGSAAPRMQRSY